MELLNNPIRHYAWGSRSAIAHLLGRSPSGRPEAEMWLGAHPDSPSTVAGSQRLDEFVSGDPEKLLGGSVRARFGDRLPFLLKVLAAEAPLSLQVHPNQVQAEAGFAAEQRRGVPRGADDRNYRDPHHKPEMVYALTSFEALCGFRDASATLGVLAGLDADGLDLLRADLALPDQADGLRQAFTRLLTLDPRCRQELVRDVALACARRLGDGSPFPREDATVVELALTYPGDPGVVASLLLNRVTLAPGQAMFLPAGNVHAYLRGCALEIMASSDNVLRGGLTAKHVDVDELLRIIDFRPGPVPYVRAADSVPGERVFAPEVEDFALTLVTPRLGAPVSLSGAGPQILLCLEGETSLRAGGSTLDLVRGQSAFVGAAEGPVEVSGLGTVVRAFTPRAE